MHLYNESDYYNLQKDLGTLIQGHIVHETVTILRESPSPFLDRGKTSENATKMKVNRSQFIANAIKYEQQRTNMGS